MGTVPMVVASTGYVNTAGNKNGGLTNDQIKKATRGLAQTAPVPADTVTPTACIGPDVLFNDVPNTGVATTGAGGAASLGNPHKTGQAVALCDPNGYRPANPADNNANAMVGAVQTARIPVPSAAQTYAANKLWYSGVNSDTANLRRSGVLVNVQKFWDPITAAQASGGAFCCDALYYGTDGIGRGRASPPGNDPPIIDVPKNTDFKPVALTGAAMDQQIVPGGVCTDGNPTTSVKEGLSAASNVEQEEFLEGQAFYTCVAPSQYVLPKVNSVATTQTANAAKQKKCARTLTGMLKLNTRSGWSELAVVPLLLHTLFPTDTATLMLAWRTLLPLAQPLPSRVCRSSQLFRAARTCLATLPLRRTLVDAPTLPVRLRLLAGMAVRPSSLRAQRPPATLQPARLRRSKGRWGCSPQPDFLCVLAVVRGFELLQTW